MPDDPTPPPDDSEVRIERVLPNPTIAPSYVNAVFSSRVGGDFILEFGHFDPVDFHQANQSGGKQTIGAWVVFRALVTPASLRRLKKLVEEFERETEKASPSGENSGEELPAETVV